MTVGKDTEEDSQTNILGFTVELVRIQEKENDTDTSGLTIRGEVDNNKKGGRKQGEREKIGRKIGIFTRAERSIHN